MGTHVSERPPLMSSRKKIILPVHQDLTSQTPEQQKAIFWLHLKPQKEKLVFQKQKILRDARFIAHHKEKGTQTDEQTSCCNSSQDDRAELSDAPCDSRVLQVKAHPHFQESHTLHIRPLKRTPAQLPHCGYGSSTQQATDQSPISSRITSLLTARFFAYGIFVFFFRYR